MHMMAPKGIRKTQNKLDRVQMRKLEDWISTQWERVETERPTYDVLAVQAATALGYAVTTGNVIGTVKVFGKPFPRPRGISHDHGAGTKARRMRAIIGQIQSMCVEMGAARTTEFDAVCMELGIE